MTRRTASAYSALCLLAGSLWILDAAMPAALPGSLGTLVNGGLLAVAFFLAGGKLPSSAFSVLELSSVILALPAALASLCDGHLSGTTIVLIYTLVPAATVFFAAQSSQEDLLSLLGPALAGVAGAALILPFALPGSLAGVLWLGVMIVSALAAGFASLRLHALLANTEVFPASALAAAAGALLALPLYLYQRPTLVLLTWQQVVLSEAVHLAMQAAVLFLSIRLFRDLQPIAFSTRYLLIPLITIVEGYLALHPTTGWTFAAGLLLIVAGSAFLLRGAYKS